MSIIRCCSRLDLLLLRHSPGIFARLDLTEHVPHGFSTKPKGRIDAGWQTALRSTQPAKICFGSIECWHAVCPKNVPIYFLFFELRYIFTLVWFPFRSQWVNSNVVDAQISIWGFGVYRSDRQSIHQFLLVKQPLTNLFELIFRYWQHKYSVTS